MQKRSWKAKKNLSGGVQRFFHPFSKGKGVDKTLMWEEGDYVIGKYFMDIKDTYGKDNPIIEVYEAKLSNPVTDKDGNTVDIEGKNLQLNSCGSLNRAFYVIDDRKQEKVERGEIVQVTYLGQFTLEEGPFAGTDCHQVEVVTLDEDEIVEEDDL